MLTGVSYQQINDKGLVIADADGVTRTLEAETVLVTLPLQPNPKLFEGLSGKGADVYAIGDCKAPGVIINAMGSAFEVARIV